MDNAPGRIGSTRVIAAFLLTMMALVLGVLAWQQSPDYDEHTHVAAGVSYLQRRDGRMNAEHPPLVKLLGGAGALIAGGRGDYNSEAWRYAREFDFAIDLYTHADRDHLRMLTFLPRVPMILITLALGLTIFLWVSSISGRGAGLLALAIYCTYPLFLAWGVFVLNDVAVALFSLLTCWAAVALWRNPSPRQIALFGLVLGAALFAKFSTGSGTTELLWPERPPKAAANNFHQALYVARRALEAAGAEASAVLPLRDDVLALFPGGRVDVDVDVFEAAVAHARESGEPSDYRAALALYGGELLSEDRYEAWAASRRDAVREAHLGLLLEFSARLTADGDIAAAIEALEQVVVVDPLHEAAHRALMRMFAADGRRQQALSQYHRLREALRRELEAEPDPQTARLYRALLRGEVDVEPPEQESRDRGARPPLARPPSALATTCRSR